MLVTTSDVINVELFNTGLFFTLGKMTPPFLLSGRFSVVVPFSITNVDWLVGGVSWVASVTGSVVSVNPSSKPVAS